MNRVLYDHHVELVVFALPAIYCVVSFFVLFSRRKYSFDAMYSHEKPYSITLILILADEIVAVCSVGKIFVSNVSKCIIA